MNHADDAVRRLARVHDEQVARATGPEAREALLERIVAMPVPDSTTPPRRRRRAALVGGAAALTLAASGTIGWAIVTAGDPRDTTSLSCQISEEADSFGIITAVSGDPVADCAAEWARVTGTSPPPMVAYDNGHGGIVVQRATLPKPPGASPLPPGAGQNVALIDLQESLDDYVAGLSSRCFSESEATAFARAELARVGFADWSVTTRANPRGATCARHGVADVATRSVVLLADPHDPAKEEGGHVLFAARLREAARTCRPLAAARAAVENAARSAGFDAADYQLSGVPSDAACTTIRLRVGGTMFVTLRGPS